MLYLLFPSKSIRTHISIYLGMPTPPCLYPSQSARRPQWGIIQLPLNYQALFFFLHSCLTVLRFSPVVLCPLLSFNISLSAPLSIVTFTVDICADNSAASASRLSALKASQPMYSPFSFSHLPEGHFWHPTVFCHYLLQTSFLGQRPNNRSFP